jgi:glycosyltransferase involved in cell wall biosynthesis
LAYIPYLHGGDLPKRYVRSNKISKRYLANASRIISPSNFLKSETEKFFNVSVQVIPNYLELDKYPYLIKSIDIDLNLLWVRAFHEIYNPVLAVKVLKKLRSIGVNCNLTMVGPDKDGSMEVVKKLAKKNGLEDSIKFTGRLKKEDWIEESKDSHIFINTTNADNTPVSVMEAMCLGLPIVSTNVGGLPYIIDNSVDGFLVNPNDFEAMADAIMLLRDNPKVYNDIGKNARIKAESWDWVEIEKKWKTLLLND